MHIYLLVCVCGKERGWGWGEEVVVLPDLTDHIVHQTSSEAECVCEWAGHKCACVCVCASMSGVCVCVCVCVCVYVFMLACVFVYGQMYVCNFLNMFFCVCWWV